MTLLASVLYATPPGIAASTPEPSNFSGIWLTDRRDGAVEIKPCGDHLCGYIYAIFRLPHPERPALDDRNENPSLRTRPLCGLQVLGGLRKLAPDKWGDGWVYDPNVGKTYRAEITLRNRDTLLLHGHLFFGFIGRTVSWHRMEGVAPKCLPPSSDPLQPH